MCGILVCVDPRASTEPQRFRIALDCLARRGPDSSGLKSFADSGVTLGHRRLSIMDLSPCGAQPMCNEDRNLWLVCNGEIYNYQDLKHQLCQLGHRFSSGSDSEVLLHAYEAWGDDFLTRLRGIFSFVLYDQQRNRLLFARDHFGVKPLYYSSAAGRLLIASEISALRELLDHSPDIDRSALASYLLFGYIPAPYTIFSSIRKLAPGCLGIYESGAFAIKRYYSLQVSEQAVSESQAITQCREHIVESVSAQNMSDVPVGIFLSGGLDSSAVAYAHHLLGNKPLAFFTGFRDDPGLELEDARLAAGCCKLTLKEQVLDTPRIDALRRTLELYGEPFADTSCIPTYLVSTLAAQHNHYKVIQSGDGGDEIFGGYRWYDHMLAKLNAASENTWRDSLLESYFSSWQYPYFLDTTYDSVFSSTFTPELAAARERFRSLFPRHKPGICELQHIDLQTYFPDDILTKVDRASMACSLEVRVPLVDPRVVEWAFSLPPEVALKAGEKKYILKRMLAEFYPERIISKPKRGFSIHARSFLQTNDVSRVLQESQLGSLGIFQTAELEKLLRADAVVNEGRLVNLLCLALWLESNL